MRLGLAVSTQQSSRPGVIIHFIVQYMFHSDFTASVTCNTDILRLCSSIWGSYWSSRYLLCCEYQKTVPR